ncbi:MAG: acyl-CoA dehydrogenase family protein [Thermoleophilia bacterium]|nr:acyl-CoA dehydrogenase family protein [Gaiellaceae bacterium]MDW8337741.1 acyl-CoA dehydrogenase family protein [Thermoleophilia bacterium]
MRFRLHPDAALFAEAVRAAIGSWEPPREPDLGAWLDDRDGELAQRLAEAGWRELGTDAALLEPAVAGALELGRACAPACLLDEPTLGGALWISGRARHGAGASLLAVPRPRGMLALAVPCGPAVPERTLDGAGVVRVEVEIRDELSPGEAQERLRAWAAVTLGYLAGLAGRALERAVAHVRSREQFGGPLGALPAVQARLADAALAADGIALLAWRAAAGESGAAVPERAWAADAACEVTAAAHQVHGAVGFALETGLHCFSRRARAVRAWSKAVSAALR